MHSLTLRYATASIAFFMSAAVALCQSDSLALSSGAVVPGGTVSLSLSLNSPSGSEPAGIEWTFTYSPSNLVANSISASLGAAATAAGKSLSCVGSPGSYTCFLTGLGQNGLNTNVIQNGVVAVLTVTIAAAASWASINVSNPLSTSAAGGAIPTTATGGTIFVVPEVSSFSCNPTSLITGGSSICTVGLSSTLFNPRTVQLTANSPLLIIPPSVVVPGGAASATFVAIAGVVITSQNVTITATLNTALLNSSASVTLALSPLTLTPLSCDPMTLNAGSASACTITLTSPAPAGGVVVAVSSDGAALTVPASVNISASSSTATFPVTVTNPPATGQSTVAVTAVLYGASQSSPFTVTICPCSVWSASAQPANPDSNVDQATEVGMRFAPEISGYVTGLRFFKALKNNGTHVGNLWSAQGEHLATVTFTNETKSGWQLAYFPSPVAVTANTTYVISYDAPNGHYAADNGSFTNALSSPPLRGLADGENGPNGVYQRGSGGFPAIGASATNFWVDPIFNTSPTIGTATPMSVWTQAAVPNTVAAPTSQPAQLGLTFISGVSGYVTGLRYYKTSTNTGEHLGYLWASTGTLLASVSFTNESVSGWQQANFPIPIAIDANIPYVVSYWSAGGHYAEDAGYFATSGVTNQILYAPPNGQYGPNGSYAASNAFPSSSSSSSNYWVDVVFSTAIQ
jgi:hypothetical protein